MAKSLSPSSESEWKDLTDIYLDETIPLKDQDDSSPLEYKSKRSRSPSTSSGKSRKRVSTQERAAVTAAEGMTSLASSMISPQLTRFDQCMEVLREMETDNEITSTDLFRISRAIMKETEYYAALFVGLPTKLRLEWLRDENLLHVT